MCHPDPFITDRAMAARASGLEPPVARVTVETPYPYGVAEPEHRAAQADYNRFLNAALFGDAPKPYRPRKRKHKLQPRVDLPPFEPWPESRPRTASEIIAGMNAARDLPKRITADRLVPADVRAASGERWRKEHEELLAAEQSAADLPPLTRFNFVKVTTMVPGQTRAAMVVEGPTYELPSRLKRFGYWLLGWKLPSDAEIIERAHAEAIERRRAAVQQMQAQRDWRAPTETDVEPPGHARRVGWAVEPGEDPKAFAFFPRAPYA